MSNKTTVKTLIEALQKFDENTPLAIMDWRMNVYHADPEVTAEGLYFNFEIAEDKLYHFNDGVIDENKPFNCVILQIDNETDYDDEGNKLDVPPYKDEQRKGFDAGYTLGVKEATQDNEIMAQALNGLLYSDFESYYLAYQLSLLQWNTDDCKLQYDDYLLRVEQMDTNVWWWEVSHNSKIVQSSNLSPQGNPESKEMAIYYCKKSVIDHEKSLAHGKG